MLLLTSPLPFRPVLLLPTYNNAPRLRPVLEAVARLGRPMIIVNDGSTDDTAAILDRFAADRPELDLTRVDHPANRGKGDALRTGFARAAELDYTHALTIDTDGQHDPADAPALLAAAEAQPLALVTGCRDASDPAYPTASRVGRLMSNLCIFISSGRRVEDSQCGYRVYPLGLVQAVRCWSGRFGYEAEILTRSGWAGCPLVQVPIRTIYPPKGVRISHFRPVKDTVHGWLLHFVMSIRAVTPWPFVKWPSPEVLAAAGLSTKNKLPLWRRALYWFDPRELMRAARRDQVSQMSVAAGLAVGVMVANLPIYGVQNLLSVYLAKRLHLHPVSTMLGAQVSFPPLNVVLISSAIFLGHLILTGRALTWADLPALETLTWGRFFDVFGDFYLAWCIGGLTIGWFMGWATFIIAMFSLRMIPVESATTVPEEAVGLDAIETLPSAAPSHPVPSVFETPGSRP